MSEFSQYMEELRQQRQLTVRGAAAKAHISPSYWTELAKGTHSNPSPQVAMAIDTALGAGGKLAALAGGPRQRPQVELPPLVSAPAPDDEPLTSADIDRMYDTVKHLIGLDQQHGADEIYLMGLRAWQRNQVRLAAGLVEPSRATDARRAAAELAEVCGWLAYDADKQELARQMLNESQLAAELVGDWDMETFVRDLRAMQALHVGRPEEALLMAQRAIAHPQVKGRMEAIFQLRRGRALAALGNQTDALDALARSRSALAEGMTSTDSPWTWWIHEAEVDLHQSLAYSALGMHAQACEVSQRSMELLPKSQVRDWSVYQAYRIGVLNAAGAHDDTVAALQALRARWADVRSTRTANLVLAAVTREGTPSQVVEAAQQCLVVAR